MENQVGSINFDANALYLEEESEHELDDKQQDNEIKELISQGGLDGILDDDSMMSSSGESSCDDDADNSPTQPHQQHNENTNYNVNHHQQQHLHHPHHNQQQQQQLHYHHNMIINGDNDQQQHQVGMMSNMAITAATTTPAHQMTKAVIKNNVLNEFRNQYSTPSNAQSAPPPQLLQATIIPNIPEEKAFFSRQRVSIMSEMAAVNHNSNSNNVLQENQFLLQQQQQQHQKYLINDNDQTIAMQQQQQQQQQQHNLLNDHGNKNDETDLIECETIIKKSNYNNLQQQHYAPNPKLHSMDKFAIPSSTSSSAASSTATSSSSSVASSNNMAQPQQQQRIINSNNHQEDESDRVKKMINDSTTSTPPHNNKIAAMANGMIKVDYNHNSNQQQQKETSIIDLNELDEAQLNQLKAEEEKQQQEYFNIDHLNRLYCQAQFLYKVRGKKLEEVSNRFAAYQEDSAREIRAMKHRLYLMEKEKESAQTSLDQAHELCAQYKAESEMSKKNAVEAQEKLDKLKQTNFMLEQKLNECEQDIENLHLQIAEQHKMDSLDRLQQQHEHFIQQLREQYDKDIYQLKEKYGLLQNDLNEKLDYIHMLRMQLETATKNSEIASVERADTINRLTKNLNDLQTKYDQEIVLVGMKNNSNININMKMSTEIDNQAKIIQNLTEKCKDLEDQVRLYDTFKLTTNNSAEGRLLDNSGNASSNINGEQPLGNTLQKELERALNSLKQKRVEIQKYQNEIEKLKADLANANQNPSSSSTGIRKNEEEEDANGFAGAEEDSKKLEEIEKLKSLIDDLQHEKIDLNNDIMEKNAKLDEMLEKEEFYQQIKNNLELEIYSKQQHIEECEKLIENLHSQIPSNNQLVFQQQQQQQQQQMLINEYESQISELKLKLTNKEHEVQKVREMYIEVCNDKNNLQDTLKEQYDSEYDKKLKHQLELALGDKLDEQKNFLKEKFNQERVTLVDGYRGQLEVHLTEIKQLKEKLINSEKQYDQLRLEKANYEIKANRVETELKEKCLNMEKQMMQSGDKAKDELIILKEQNLKMESNFSDLKLKYEKEKQHLSEKIDQLIKEKEELTLGFQNKMKVELTENEMKISELSKTLKLKEQAEDTKFKELQDKLSEKNDEVLCIKKVLNETELKIEKLQETLKEETEKKIKLEELNSQNKQSFDAMIASKTQQITDETNKLNQVRQKFQQLQSEYDEAKKTNQKLIETLNELNQEKVNLVNRKDEELQKVIFQLEKRFEQDYSKFMEKHKDSMYRTLSEKSQEHAREKEKLIELYQGKLNDLEANEQTLQKQMKELKEKLNSNTNKPSIATEDISVQTEETPAQISKSPLSVPNELSKQQRIEELTSKNEYINSLLNKIASLEEVISNTDAHFEIELEKLRQELDEEYQSKLKYELKKEELNRKQLEQELESLKYQLMDSNKNNNSSGNQSTNSSTTSLNDDEINLKNYSSTSNKYSKLKNDLNMKEKEMESVEQTYRMKMDQIQNKFEEHVKQIKQKYETDLQRVKVELNDNYKQALNKSKTEIEQMQLFVQKLKKTNLDSDKVIESLKLEMNKIKEAHLGELTNLKMNSEREKETLKDQCEKLNKKINSLEHQLAENDESYRKQCDLLRAELKHECGIELSRMNTKMKDMMKSHSAAVELLKKQHQSATQKLHSSSQSNKNIVCQTDITFKDIELLEAFRQKYLETLSRMKSDMMKEFDAQTMRVSERAARKLDEERLILNEKIHAIIIPKIVDLLREFRISETIIRLKTNELQRELDHITSASNSDLPNKKKDPSSDRSNDSQLSPTIRFNEQNLKDNQPTNVNGIAKRSVSNLLSTNRPSSSTSSNHISKTTSDDLIANILYSKSATSILSQQQQQFNGNSGSTHSLVSNSSNSNRNNKMNANSENNLKDAKNTVSIDRSANKNNNRTSLTQSNSISTTPLTLSTGGYKYTPLRQSWSNLSQMNQVSPYSIGSSANSESSRSGANNNKNTLYEEADNNQNNHEAEEMFDRFDERKSPSFASSTSAAYRLNLIKSRPNTADSILTKKTKNSGDSIDEAKKKLANNYDDIDHQKDVISKVKQQQQQNRSKFHEEKAEDLVDDKDYVYFDDENEENETDFFYNKHRLQNIRLKKTSSTQKSIQNMLASLSPRSNDYNQDKLSVHNQKRPSSATIVRNSQHAAVTIDNHEDNAINTLYERAKNYKTIQTDNKANHKYLMRSNTNIEGSFFEKNSFDIKPKMSKQNSMTKVSNDCDMEENDQLPIRLSSKNSKLMTDSTKSIATRSTSSIGYFGGSSTRSSSNTSTRTGASSKQASSSAINSNTLPRSHTPTKAIAQSILNYPHNQDAMPITSHSYRSSTIASNSKKVSTSNDSLSNTTASLNLSEQKLNNSNLLSTAAGHHLHTLSTASTQYHPISNGLGSNLVKNPSFLKKKAVFY